MDAALRLMLAVLLAVPGWGSAYAADSSATPAIESTGNAPVLAPAMQGPEKARGEEQLGPRQPQPGTQSAGLFGTAFQAGQGLGRDKTCLFGCVVAGLAALAVACLLLMVDDG